MEKHYIRQLPGAATSATDLDERRQAPWLQSNYSDAVWQITDTRDATKKKRIDFRFRLPDGRLLIENNQLCGTVKEYAWWVRDSRFSRIETAQCHAVVVRNLMNIAHALVLEGIPSFSHLQPYDVEQLVEKCRFGADAVLRASERVENYLQEISSLNEQKQSPVSRLPAYKQPHCRSESKKVHVERLLEACRLPSGAQTLPRVAAVIAKAAKAHGMFTRASDKIPALSNVTIGSLSWWLAPLEQLYAMRRRLEAESITFKPFPRGAARIAAVKGFVVGRTPTPPPMLVLHLLEFSARWIFDRRETLSTRTASRQDVVRMATACWIIITAFTARRDGEVDDLREGCLRGDEASGWWLHVYIEKTLQRKEWIPVPLLVAQAVQTLSSISRAARAVTGTDLLFQWINPKGKVVRLDVGRHLDDFAAAVNVPLHNASGELPLAWHWHPHQFRRFFAVLYFYRFEGATIEALSHHLRHFSLEMTRRYVTQDPEVAALWTDVEWGYAGHVARSIVSGDRAVSGAAGERLKKMASRLLDTFRRRLQVATPERVGASLALIMQRQGLVLIPKPWVTCSCPRTRDAANKAACRRGRPDDLGAIGPDFAHAGPSVCPFCPHAIIEGERTAIVEAEVRHLEAATASAIRKDTIFGALESARVIELWLANEIQYQGARPLVDSPAETGFLR